MEVAEPFPAGLGGRARMQALAALGKALPLRRQLELVSMFEPHPPWNRSFLEFRAEVLRRMQAPGLAAAEADLAEFRSRAGSELLPGAQ